MPVIATNVGEFPEFVNANRIGLIIDGRLDPQELSASMQNLIEDETLFSEFAANAARLMQASTMTWEHEWNKVRHSGVFESSRRAA